MLQISKSITAALTTACLISLNPSTAPTAASEGVSADPRPSVAEILTWHPPEGQPATEPGFEPYRDGVGVVVRLSREEIAPVTRFGEPLDPEGPWYRAYRDSVDRFPDVQSCLAGEDQQRDRPDLAHFDWEKMATRFDAEVCLFRIATSYRTAGDVESWLQAQGFETESAYLQAYRPDRNYVGGQDLSLWGRWSVRTKGALIFRNLAEKAYFERNAYALVITFTFRPSIGVFDTDVGYLIN